MALIKNPLNKVNKISICYIYQKSNPNFWENIDYSFKHFSDVFIVNISSETLATNRKNLKIVDVEKDNFYSYINKLFLTKKSSSHIIFLEANEKVVFDENVTLSEDNDYNIKIKPSNYEIYDYSVSPFTSFENRVFSLKRRNTKDFFEAFDFFTKGNIPVINQDIAYILKDDFSNDFEILKSDNLTEKSNRSNFFKATSYFYRDSILSDKLYRSVLASEDKAFKSNSLSLLMKLLLRKEEYEKVLNLYQSFPELIDSNSSFYLGTIYFKQKNYAQALKYFHNSIKLAKIENSKDSEYFINEKVVYNHSDITYKLYKSIAMLFYEIGRLKNSEKYFNIALEFLKDKSSQEIKLYIGRIRFNEDKYEEAYEIFSEIIKDKSTSPKILKELKQPLINLMMYLNYRDNFHEILTLDFIDHQDDILRVADTYYMNGDYINALQLYITSVKKFGYDQKLLFKLGYISSMLRSLDQACYYFEKYLEKDPDDLTALTNLAFIYLSMEKSDLAEKSYLKIISLNSYSYEANLYLAIIYMSKGEKDKAETYINKARTLNPTSTEIINLYKIFKKEFV